MMTSRSSFPPPLFCPDPALTEEGDAFVTLRVDVQKVLKSYQKSLFAFEWLDPATGALKSFDVLAEAQQRARADVEAKWKKGVSFPQPVLGIGLLESAEIGSGRAIFMTMAAHGVGDIPVHVPAAMYTAVHKFAALPTKKTTPEKGGAFMYILLAVVLIAALSYAIANTSRNTGVSTVSDGTASNFATEILTYAGHMKEAIGKLQLRGCTDAQMNFDNSTVAGYTNAGAPGDGSCDVFNASAGSITWATPPDGMNDGSPWFYTGAAVAHQQNGFASTNVAGNADLVMMLPGLSAAVCTKINTRLGIGGTPVDDGAYADATKFQGSYSAAEDINGLPEAAQPSPCSAPSTSVNLCGRDAGCFREEGGGQRYIFTQVLIQR